MKFLKLENLYEEIGHFYPDVHLSQFNNHADSVQGFFYEIMGGNPDEWGGNMLNTIQAIHATTPNFNYFTGKGEDHCVLPYDRVYFQQSNGVKIIDWLRMLVDDEPVANVDCKNCSI